MLINFYCRQSKVDRKGEAPIEVSFTINGQRVIMPTKMRAEPSVFASSMASKRKNYIREYTDGVKMTFNQALAEMTALGKSVTASTLKEWVTNGGDKRQTLANVYAEFMTLIKKRVGINITPKAAHRYENVRDVLFECIDPETEMNKITKGQLEKFYIYLRGKYKVSTAALMMTKVQSVMQYAFDNGYIPTNPKIKFEREKPIIEYLTQREVDAIKMAILPEKLDKVRDLFIFQANTGLSYVDMAQLVREDIQSDGNSLFIQKNRQKTGVEFTSVVLPDGVRVLEKYGYELPIISNQKYNDYLKVIAERCNIAKTLHTHLARKTYCTHLLNAGVRMEAVSKCAGHSNTRVTAAIYAHLQTETIISEVSKVI